VPFPPRFPSLAAFGRRPLGARGSISIGPASETHHNSRRRPTTPACPASADIVAKVENRTTLKISRKLIFGFFCRCVAFQRH
jgi:hypothetical protein